MPSFETTAELKTGALERAGELTDGRSDYDSSVLDQMDQVYRAIFSGSHAFNVDLGEVWSWAKAKDPGLLILQPALKAGTVALTQDSTTATLSIAPAVGLGSLSGWFLQNVAEDTVYRVSSHVAASTTLILDQAYIETSESGAKYRLFKLDYTLTSGIERLAGPMRVNKRQIGSDAYNEVIELEDHALRRDFPINRTQVGAPNSFSVIYSEDGQHTVRFNRYPSERIRVEYDYIPHPKRLLIRTFLDASVTVGSDLITISGHGFSDGQLVRLATTGVLPAGLSGDVSYYVVNATSTTFKLSLTLGGSAVDITAAAGGGTHTISSIPLIPRARRQLLMNAAAHFVLTDKSDSRADYYMRLAQADLQALLQDNRKRKTATQSWSKGRLTPRLDSAANSLADRAVTRLLED